MTKYYFISYMCQTGAQILNRHCLYKAVDQPLYEICNDIAEINNTTSESVVITCLKDLTKKEYKMLSGDNQVKLG